MSNLIEKLSPGDIILYRGKSFVSKSILFFMEIYRRKLKLPKRILYNHAAMIVNYKSKVFVVEANGKGIEVNEFVKKYGYRLNTIKIISPKKPYSKTEKNKISDIAIEDAFNPTRYDFANFFFQISMVLSTSRKKGTVKKTWKGPEGKKAEKRLYCTEAVATWANEIRPNTFNAPWSINPLDVDLNKYYKEIFNGVTKGKIS